jgi:hypothetical protein
MFLKATSVGVKSKVVLILTMKGYMGNRGIAALILNLGIRRR